MVDENPVNNEIQHGTIRSYRLGCKCEECRKVPYTHLSKYRADMVAKGNCIECAQPRTGTRSHLRCDACLDRMASTARAKRSGSPSLPKPAVKKLLEYDMNAHIPDEAELRARWAGFSCR